MAVQRIPFSAAESEFVEKRSRFIGQIWPVSTEEEAQAHIRAAKKKYHDARHNCWCYLLGDNVLRYSDDGVRDVIKNIILPLWNSYSFYVTYANIDGVQPTGHLFDSKTPSNPLDAWLLSITQKLVKDVTSALDDYDLSGAVDPIVKYIDEMNNWYIRRSRRRFWKSENDSDI